MRKSLKYSTVSIEQFNHLKKFFERFIFHIDEMSKININKILSFSQLETIFTFNKFGEIYIYICMYIQHYQC